MIVVIQCAAGKRSGAGRLLSADGRPVVFVARPDIAPADPACLYARPDDQAGTGLSWRQALLNYNRQPENTLGLYAAWQLYGNKAYSRLVDRFGLQKVYILSAGWGLINADFLTPSYDITFSQSADGYKRRRKSDLYQDFCMLPDRTDENIVFFGGKDYLPLFCSLTGGIRSRKIVFYNSAIAPQATGYTLERYETATRTNWHYECANAFLDGRLAPLLR